MKTLSVANQKGGCGKTTTAINLSSALALLGKRILLIDLDPQSHASYGLGIMNETVNKSVYNVLTDSSDNRCALNECILKITRNLDIIPSNILLSTLEQELKDKEDAVSRLHDILATAALNYDYIVIDCPPSLGFLTFNALRAADMVLVPIDMSAFSLMGVAKLLGMLELIKVKINHAPKVRSVATIFDRRSKYSDTMLNEIKGLFRDQLLGTIIRMNVALKKAVSKGVSVMEFDNRSNGAIDYTSLAREILIADETEKAEADRAKALIALANEKVEQAIDEPIEQTVEQTIEQPEQAEQQESIDSSAAIEEAVNKMIKEVIFAISAPEAKEIHILGDFNQWKIGEETRLLKRDDGSWEKRMALTPGKYRYKFVVDGQWVLDNKNPERQQNMFGTFDSVAEL